MSLRITRIADRGVPNKERLHLSVLQKTTLSSYAVVRTRYSGLHQVANGNLTAFWFPSQLVSAGDQIILYSGSGKPSSHKEPNGSTTHFFYWGLPNTVWNEPADCVVLLGVANWATSALDG